MTLDIRKPEDRWRILQDIQPEAAERHHALLRQIFRLEMDYHVVDEDRQYYENLYRCGALLAIVDDPDDRRVLQQFSYIVMRTNLRKRLKWIRASRRSNRKRKRLLGLGLAPPPDAADSGPAPATPQWNFVSPDIRKPEDRRRMLQDIQPEEAKRHHAVLRQIFRLEMDYRSIDEEWDYYESMYWCGYLLFMVGDPRDVRMLWEGKYINMDTGIGFDIHALFGAGYEETVAYLRANGGSDIVAELDGFAQDLTPERLARWPVQMRDYYYSEQSYLSKSYVPAPDDEPT
ncbi:hypothetical protein ABIE09_003851 [Lysobacter enzymogenes]|uniref:hypothetical protein n=1 Tax=Lysobacter enzymogenes TaxID=69 RepID=UPI0033947A9A